MIARQYWVRRSEHRRVQAVAHGGVQTVGQFRRRDPGVIRIVGADVLRIAVDGEFVGFVDVTEVTTLEEVRQLIKQQVSPATRVRAASTPGRLPCSVCRGHSRRHQP